MGTEGREVTQAGDGPERFEGLLETSAIIKPEPAAAADALVPDYQAEYDRAASDLERFWSEIAADLEWERPWDRVLEWQVPYARWFIGARCNITINALDRHVRAGHGDKLAWLWVSEDGQERRFTYSSALELACRIANALTELGVRRGDRVCIYIPLTPEGMATMLACARIGAIHLVVYAGMGEGALRDRILDSGARIVVTADEGYRRGKAIDLLSICSEAVAQTPEVGTVLLWRRNSATALPESGPTRRWLDFDEIVARQPATREPEIMDSEEVLFLLYTSGTTGKPKAPVFVHGGYAVGASYYTRIAFDLRSDDLYWCMSDIGWMVGHSAMVYGAMIEGVSLLVREGAPDAPHPGVVWELIERYGVTKLFTAPTTIRMWMKFGDAYPARYDRSSLRLLVCAGEPLNPEAYEWARRNARQGGAEIRDNWWQTETAGPTIGTLLSMPSKPGRAGKPLPGYEARVLDRTGNPVAPGTIGFLVLTTPWPQMMRTIWNASARYEEYWHGVPGGCYTAGDVATIDEDGYIAVLGRADDVLNVAGHRIGTADVESALVGHPTIAEAAAIGIPDATKGEAIKVFVVLREGQTWSTALGDELIAQVRRELGPIATPAAIECVSALPRTRSGKIMRRLLKAQELGLDPGDLTTLEL
jgi:acetyl-CoA synthetase